jgi:hypothetical protein
MSRGPALVEQFCLLQLVYLTESSLDPSAAVHSQALIFRVLSVSAFLLFQVLKELRDTVIPNVDILLEKLNASNAFFIARRFLKETNQDVLYLSIKLPPNVPLLVELTFAVGDPGVKVALKTSSTEYAPLFFDAIDELIKSI